MTTARLDLENCAAGLIDRGGEEGPGSSDARRPARAKPFGSAPGTFRRVSTTVEIATAPLTLPSKALRSPALLLALLLNVHFDEEISIPKAG